MPAGASSPAGTPEQIAATKGSYTGDYLRPYLKPAKTLARLREDPQAQEGVTASGA